MLLGRNLYQSTNKSLVDNVLKALGEVFPLTSKDGKVVLEGSNFRVDLSKYNFDDLKKLQTARSMGESLTVPIFGDMVLKRDGAKAQSLRNFRLGELPVVTALGTFMVGGNDYFTPKQLRLKPGFYTREMNNGQLETFINVRGRPMRLWMEPANGILKWEYGSSNVDLIPVLQGLGVEDAKLKDALGGGKVGTELFERNLKPKAIDTQLTKLYKAIFEHKQNRDLVRAGLVNVESEADNLSRAEKASAIVQWLGKQESDEFTTRKTLGTPFAKLSTEALLSGVRKLLAVSRGTSEPDDRDATEFKTLHGVEDLMPERLKRNIRYLAGKAMTRLSVPDTTIARGLGKDWLNPMTVQYFGGNQNIEGGLAHTAEAANPLAILSEHTKVTLKGDGGIGSDHAITQSARLFRPNSFGLIDPVHTPEGCYTEDMLVYCKEGWIPWPKVNGATALACNVNGALQYHFPGMLIAVDHDGYVVSPTAGPVDFAVTPNHRMVLVNEAGKHEVFFAGDLVDKAPGLRVPAHLQAPERGAFKVPSLRRIPYTGKVYCAQVPGGMLFVRRGSNPGFWCGNSEIGVTTHLAALAEKAGNKILTPVYKVEGGKLGPVVKLSAEEVSDSIIGYPEYWDGDTKKPLESEVRANKDGRIETVPVKEVQYVYLHGQAMLDHTSASALFFDATHANRGMMAGKHLTQALPLVHRELPASATLDPKGRNIHETFGDVFTIRSTVDGTVDKVTKTEIVVSGTVHQILDTYPMQAKVAITHIPVVKVGDKVKKGQLLADTNYTKDGKLALGVNLRSAYTPWRGAGNFEDAIVVSESAAKKLTSEHVHRLELWKDDPALEVNKKILMAQYPSLITAANAAVLDEEGIVKPGSKLEPGWVAVAAVAKKSVDKRDEKSLGELHKILERPYRNRALIWDEDYVGEVVRVVKRDDAIIVHLRTEEPLQVADKLSMSSEAKGTISMIIPDDKMPKDSKGRPIEVIFNPHGVAGRINPSQTIEQAAGKLVLDHGVKFDHTNFSGENYAKKAKELLEKHGDSHAEKLFDPETGKHTEEPVAVGYNYVFKLDHPVRKKFSARERDGYTADETPIRGKGRGGQSFDQLTTYALLGHNAHAILGESMGIRGAKNDDYWHAFQAGETPPPPKVPFVFEKFRNFLAAAGVDTKQRGTTLHYLPMTEKRILEQSNGEIAKANMLRARGSKALDVVEEKGGLFDPKLTGGLKGDKWNHITLPEAVPHPLYEKVIRDMTDTKTSDYYGLLGHTRFYEPATGKFHDEAGEGRFTGADGFKQLLSFDPKAKLKEIKAALKTAVGSDRNKLNRAHRYILGLEETGLTPTEAYMTKVVPVIPPKFRPVIEMKGGALRVADANLLYRDLMLSKEQVEQSKHMPADLVKDQRLALYQGFGALVGVNNPLTHRDDREDARGFVDIIKGKANKHGLFQSMLMRRRNDYTGRSTIEPDASLGPDEIAIPEEMAWKIYKPVLVRRMVQNGWSPADAMKQVEQRTPAAKQVLDAEMLQRPVVYNRAPSLHKLSVATAIPRLAPGKEIKISPIVLGPYGADFDGDTMSVVVPISESARHEALGMLPSKNLFYDKDRKLAYGLEKDIITGLFVLTRPGVQTGKTFETEAEAIAAFRDPKQNLRMDSVVQVKGLPAKYPIGWLIFRSLVPERFTQGLVPPLKGGDVEKLLTRVASEAPAQFNDVSRKLAMAGFEASARHGGITSTVNELAIDRTKIDKLLAMMEKDVEAVRKRKLDPSAQHKELKKINDHYAPGINTEVLQHLDTVGHGYSVMMQAGASGKINPDQFRQMLASPMLMSDVRDLAVPAVIRSSYGSGMRSSDYVMTTPGARKGLVARSLATALPGFLAKEVAGGVAPIRISMKDCGTHKGVDERLDSKLKGSDSDLLDRVLADDVPGVGKRNEVITPVMLAKAKDKGLVSLKVRSPLTCEADKPPCQLCAGRDVNGQLHPVGSNIGFQYGQAVSERSTQLVLRSFHSGGTLGSGDSLNQGFSRLRELLSAPDTVRDQGTLADVAGTVSETRLAPQGGYFVYVRPAAGGMPVEHHIQQGRTVKVSVGDHVAVGDPLSDGSYRPQELAVKKGLLVAQQYVTDEARKAYAVAGATVRKPVIEVLVSGLMRYMEITDDGGENDLAPGDVIHENEFKKRKAKNPRIQGIPTVPGISKKPIVTSKDMMERLSFQRLEDAIREVPAIGGKSDLTGRGAPQAGFAYGIAFRPGESAPQLRDSAFERLTP